MVGYIHRDDTDRWGLRMTSPCLEHLDISTRSLFFGLDQPCGDSKVFASECLVSWSPGSRFSGQCLTISDVVRLELDSLKVKRRVYILTKNLKAFSRKAIFGSVMKTHDFGRSHFPLH